jgi:hypothetical protein
MFPQDAQDTPFYMSQNAGEEVIFDCADWNGCTIFSLASSPKQKEAPVEAERLANQFICTQGESALDLAFLYDKQQYLQYNCFGTISVVNQANYEIVGHIIYTPFIYQGSSTTPPRTAAGLTYGEVIQGTFLFLIFATLAYAFLYTTLRKHPPRL